jgi:hypothetical protein
MSVFYVHTKRTKTEKLEKESYKEKYEGMKKERREGERDYKEKKGQINKESRYMREVNNLAATE